MRFATTRWSLIMDARGDAASAREALEGICRAYREPVLAYIRSRGQAATDAEDLAQEFFTQLFETRWDTRADPERGRFRAFMLGALLICPAARLAAARAARGGGAPATVSIDDAAAALATPPSQSPEQVFERSWALVVVDRAFERLREEAARAGKLPVFERLAPYLGDPAESADYRRIGEELGLRPNTLAVTVHRMRARLRELVRAELGEQTDSREALEQELRVMRKALLGPRDVAGACDRARLIG